MNAEISEVSIVDHYAPNTLSAAVTAIWALDSKPLNKSFNPEPQPGRQPALCAAETVPIQSLEALKQLKDDIEGRFDMALVMGDTRLQGAFQLGSKRWMIENFGGHPDFAQAVQEHGIQRLGVKDADGTMIVQRNLAALSSSLVSYFDIDNIPLDRSVEDVLQALKVTFAEFAETKLLVQLSASSGVNLDGVPVANKYGLHGYFKCATPTLLKAYFGSRADEFNSLGCGKLDLSVFGQSNRISYGSPYLAPGLSQPRREAQIIEGDEAPFAVQAAWLPPAPETKRLDVQHKLSSIVPKGKQGEATDFVAELVNRLVAKLQHVQQGDRHSEWRDLCHLLGGFLATGCLVLTDEELETLFMGSVAGWPEWADKDETDLLRILRSGLVLGAQKPCWPQGLAQKHAAKLFSKGVTTEQLGIRLIADDGPVYYPAGGELFASDVESGFIKLPGSAHQAAMKVVADGGKTNYLMRGGMGCGKTEVAKQIGKDLKDFTAITPSVSLATSGAKRLDLRNYQTVTDKSLLRGIKRLAICQNSLNHLRPTRMHGSSRVRFFAQKNVLIDEIEQVLSRFTNGHASAGDFAVFQEIIRNAETLIIADANLKQSTVDWIKKLRPEAQDIALIHSGKMISGLSVKSVDEKAGLLAAACTSAAAGNQVYFCADSRKEAGVAFEMLQKVAVARNPAAKCLLVTSETREDEEVKTFLANPQSARDYDVLSVSPTLSTGVDFTFVDAQGEREKLFDVFGSFGGGSIGAEQSVQMLRRVRNPLGITVYANPATGVWPKVDYARVREQIKRGQFTLPDNADAGSPFSQFERVAYKPFGELTDPRLLMVAASLVLNSEFFDAIAARNMDFDDISHAALKLNIFDLLERDGATVVEEVIEAGLVEAAKGTRKALKKEAAERWTDNRLEGSYIDPNSREETTGLTAYTFNERDDVQGTEQASSGAARVREDLFLFKQLYPFQKPTAELLQPMYDNVFKSVEKQYFFGLLHKDALFIESHDRKVKTGRMLDLGARREVAQQLMLIKHLASIVDLDLTTGKALDGSKWRWTPTPESVGALLHAVKELPEMFNILGLTAKTHKAMVTQFNMLLGRFWLKLDRVKNGAICYNTLGGWDAAVERMQAQKDYVAALTDKECKAVQWLQVEARQRVLEKAGCFRRGMKGVAAEV